MSYSGALGAIEQSEGQKCMSTGGRVKPNPDGSFHYCYYPAGTVFASSGSLRKADVDEVADAKGNRWLFNRSDGSWDFVSYGGNIISQNAAAPPGGLELINARLETTGSALAAPSGSSQACPPEPLPTSMGQKGPAVVCWQRFLISQGFNLGPTGADGDHGGKTEAATQAFKGSKGGPAVKPPPKPDPKTTDASLISGVPDTALYVGGAGLVLLGVALIAKTRRTAE